MKHLHIMNDDKFIEPYIRFIEEYFYFQKHKFIILSKNNKNSYYNNKKNIFQYHSKKDYLKILKDLYLTDNIFLHGLFNRNIFIILFTNPWLLKKCKWILWGGDLYSYKKRLKKRKLKSKIYNYMIFYVIKNIEGIITYIKGDYKLAQQWYKTKANYYKCICYLSNIPSYNIPKTNFKINTHNKEHIFIQVGNSADPSNNHVEILDKIKENKNENEKIKIICPLSYGKEDQKKKVIKYGKKVFGKDFVPLTKFMDLKTYNKLLSNIDIAIFNHQRQQAMGNILTLLYLGKKVYIRDDIVTWDFMQENDIKVFSFNNSNNDLLDEIDSEVAKKNRKKIDFRFNIDVFIEEWSNIFNS
ncbi:4-alpha-L-fucosyltransferase (glycosyl transferase family 56) [Halanaerobium congolense]|uniref:4-alpha-L-fucosyltransferase (Glycosyl transferase family 56) n=1 Tax=Halanaerobium congolense TaxID=54121 RepID=A0A4R8GKR0_9FIRM|nr:TDP-N-acetylfucosamine:lipid II N-acetylfucosaminyltransferase [Halanaerobium congolense]TDX42941.1 4-alpha-L-fucosyltransferase (glycosyl transferase family 56) [Halanaerobium congolense]